MKTRRVGAQLRWFCPACLAPHGISTLSWEWDGNTEAPTISPSVLVTYNGPDGDVPGRPPSRCHCFVRAGQVEFCGDSSHDLAGETVPLPDLPEVWR